MQIFLRLVDAHSRLDFLVKFLDEHLPSTRGCVVVDKGTVRIDWVTVWVNARVVWPRSEEARVKFSGV
jgi:hypothetical protein